MAEHEGLEVRTLPPNVLVRETAEYITGYALHCVSHTGRFVWALSGGATPLPLYETLAGEPWHRRFPWNRTHLFWTDERCVPHGDPSSNYGAMHEILRRHKAPVPPRNVHRIRGELRAEVAAPAYEHDIRRVLGLDGVPEPPGDCFNLVSLGMGIDGHTASLFPDGPELLERSRWAAAVMTPKREPARRVTLTLPVLNAAVRVLFLITGVGKAALLGGILGGDPALTSLPAALVHGRGATVWFTDQDPGEAA